ncbi:hypothetical protein [uncultured Christiangramia sp.]|uniref:hypothetical protein n=1 Tax=Christiangramia sp. 3-2217-3z TaxID=3417564 RepID=UPI00261293AB|nr:hypothetical protein [uncultured Christiangramia sp.]
MKLYLPTLIVFILLLASCSNDDELNQEKQEEYFVNSEDYNINKAYYTKDLSTERRYDFIIIFTDGEITSFSNNFDEIKFSDSTTSMVIFRCIQDRSNGLALNFAPSGSYIFDTTSGATLNFAQFQFNCSSSNNNLENCQLQEVIDSTSYLNEGTIEIEIVDTTSDYDINYSFEITDSKTIIGSYSGPLERFD